MDYAAKLRAPTASAAIGPGSAQALAGGYANYLPGMGQQPTTGAFKLALPEGASVTPEQRSIIDTLMSVMNNASRAR